MRAKLSIPDEAWLPNDALEDPRSRLLTTIEINGTSMHLEAWEVYVDDSNVQQLTSNLGSDDLENLAMAVSADGHMDTTEITGREYILVATPHC